MKPFLDKIAASQTIDEIGAIMGDVAAAFNGGVILEKGQKGSTEYELARVAANQHVAKLKAMEVDGAQVTDQS